MRNSRIVYLAAVAAIDEVRSSDDGLSIWKRRHKKQMNFHEWIVYIQRHFHSMRLIKRQCCALLLLLLMMILHATFCDSNAAQRAADDQNCAKDQTGEKPKRLRVELADVVFFWKKRIILGMQRNTVGHTGKRRTWSSSSVTLT